MEFSKFSSRLNALVDVSCELDTPDAKMVTPAVGGVGGGVAYSLNAFAMNPLPIIIPAEPFVYDGLLK